MTEEILQTNTNDKQLGVEKEQAIRNAVNLGIHLSTILDLKELISTVVEQIQQTFDYSHVQLYLLDDTNKDSLILKGGTGKLSKTMISKGHSIQRGVSLVGRSLESKEILLIPDTASHHDWLYKPSLPQIRSEIAVPLKVGDEVIGVLNVMQDEANRLSYFDGDLLQIISNQIAVSVRNARLYEQVQIRAESEQRLNTIAQLIQATASIVQAVRVSTREISHLTHGPVRFKVNPDISHERWTQYLVEENVEDLNYTYDPNRVLASNRRTPAHNSSKPLTVRGEILGEVVIINKKNSLDETTDNLISIIIDRLGSHIEKLRLTTQTQKALNETDVLLNIIADLNAARNYQDVITAISSRTILSAADQSLILCLFDQPLRREQRPEWIIPVAYKAEFPVEIATRYPINAFEFIPNTLFTENVVVIEDTSIDHRFDSISRKVFLDLFHSNTVVIIPLMIAERSIGFILANYSGRVKFSAAEINRLRAISNQVAITVQGLIFLELAKSQARREQLLREITAASSTVLEPKHLLQSVVDLVKGNFNLYHAQIFLVDEFNKELVLAAGSGDIGRLLVNDQITIPLFESSIPGRAVATRTSQIVNDIGYEFNFQTNPHLPYTASELTVPMIVGNHLLGVLDIHSDRPADFNEDDLQTFTTLATQTAVALQNAQLFSEQAITVDRLQEVDRLKSSFLATMSHELRTPLNSILGFTQVILEGIDGPVTEFMEADLRLIEKNGKHLLNLINEVLDMAKIESGRISISFEPVNIRFLLEEVVDTISPQVNRKLLYINLDLLPDDDLLISADPIRIRQVMLNLVGNAIKFTDNGGITIKVRKYAEKIICDVIDTGLGIHPDKLEEIFEAFSQLDTSSTRKENGTGLGLSISRRFAELHGGKLWAESTGINGQGSTFHLELPIQPFIT